MHINIFTYMCKINHKYSIFNLDLGFKIRREINFVLKMYLERQQTNGVTGGGGAWVFSRGGTNILS